MIRTAALPAAVALLAACNGDPAPRSPAAAAAGSGAAPAARALPAGEQCLWLSICSKWSGCAHIAKAPPSWKVITAPPLTAGAPVDVVDMCSGDPVCMAARGAPAGEVCTNSTIIFVAEPDYTCAWNGTACAATPRPEAAP